MPLGYGVGVRVPCLPESALMQWGARSMCSQPPGPSRGEAGKVLSVGGGSGGECGDRGGFREVSSVGGGVCGGGSGRGRRVLRGPVRVVGTRGCRRGPEGAAGIRGCCGGWCAQPGTEGAAGTGAGSRDQRAQPGSARAGPGAGWRCGIRGAVGAGLCRRDQTVPPGSDGAAWTRGCWDRRASPGLQGAVGTGTRCSEQSGSEGPAGFGPCQGPARVGSGPCHGPAVARAGARRGWTVSGGSGCRGWTVPGGSRCRAGPFQEAVGVGGYTALPAFHSAHDRFHPLRPLSAATVFSPEFFTMTTSPSIELS